MNKIKRTKNIFNEQIVNESLFHIDDHSKFRIGDLEVKAGWLRGIQKDKYLVNVYSCLQLAELKQQLEQLKNEALLQAEQNQGEPSSPTKANMFKIALLKKQIKDFVEDDSYDKDRINKLIDDHKHIKAAKSPSTLGMVVQKVTGIMDTCYQRTCEIEGNYLIIESKKDHTNKHLWPKIDLDKCKITLEKKQSPLNIPKFEKFIWPVAFESRLLLELEKADQKSYCLYAQPKQIEELLKYVSLFHFEDTLQKNKGSMFPALNNQLYQKVITIFANKLRMYDHHIKSSQHEREAKVLVSEAQQIEKRSINHSNDKELDSKEGEENKPKDNGSAQKIPNDFNSPKGGSSDGNISEVMFSPSPGLRRKSISGMNMSMFKLKSKKANVFYDEIENDVPLQEERHRKPSDISSPFKKESITSPECQINDFMLEMDEEIGMSEADSSSETEVVMNRKRTTNISVSGHMFNLDRSQGQQSNGQQNRFNINIHEIQTESEQESSSEYGKGQHEDEQSYPFLHERAYELGNSQLIESLNNSAERAQTMKSDPVFRRNNTSSISSLHLEEIIEREEAQKNYSEPHHNNSQSLISPQSIPSKGSPRNWFQSKAPKLCLMERSLDMYAYCKSIEMLYPYHQETLAFSLLQLDPNIEMQKYRVICSQSEFEYSCDEFPHFHFKSKDQKQNLFGIHSDSHEFIFVLKESMKHQTHFEFTIDLSQVRYQVDQSQLILIKVNSNNKSSPKNSVRQNIRAQLNLGAESQYKFAAILHLLISPTPIEKWEDLSTVEFLSQFRKMTVHDRYYDFKYNFIQSSCRKHELAVKINKGALKSAIKQNKKEQFARLVWGGIPSDVMEVFRSNLTPQKKKNLDDLLDLHLDLEEKEYKMFEEAVIPYGLKNLQILSRPLIIIKTLLDPKHYNRETKRRLYELIIYLNYKHPEQNIQESLFIAFTKEILRKIQLLLETCKTEQEVTGIILTYLEVEYELQSLFEQIAKYF